MIVNAKFERTIATQFLSELARLSAKPIEEVLRIEGGSVLKLCALEEKLASAAAVRRQVRSRYERRFEGSGGLISGNYKRNAGRVWFTQERPNSARGANGARGSFYMIYDAGGGRGWHVPGPIWAEYQITVAERSAKISAEIEKRLPGRGLTRQSWLQCIAAVGVNADAIAPQRPIGSEIVAKAVARDGNARTTGFATINRTSDSAVEITFTNAGAIANKNGASDKIERNLSRRQRAFENNFAHGVFEDVANRAARYPGIFVVNPVPAPSSN